MRVFGSLVVTGMTVAALGCGGDRTTESREMAANESAAEQHSNQPDMAAQTRTSLTGCLLAGGEAGTFVLQLASAGDRPSGSAGSPPAEGSAWAPGATYQVRAADSTDLSAHLNTMVAIEGPVAMATAGSVGTSGAAGSKADDSRAERSGAASRSMARDGMTDDLPMMRAESVRKVADQCSSTGTPSPRSR
jgi:hypothetical protein